jgi:hypothetical protein
MPKKSKLSPLDDPEVQAFVRAFVQALKDRNAAIFAGAGLSIPAGMVNWKTLLSEIAREIKLDVNKEDDLVSLAQYHVTAKGTRHPLNEKVLNEFSSRATLTANHRILAQLPIRTFWTTNYDTLIEESIKQAGKRPDVKLTVENLANTLHDRDAIVYKMHGDVSLPDKTVLTKDDYEAYGSTHQLFSSALQGDLVSKTFLFIGFSFTDPNLAFVLSRIRLLLGNNKRTHYCLMRRVQRTDFKSAAEFNYARGKQDLQVKDLKRYGIQGVLVDDYADYKIILERVRTLYRRSTVFISGSAATYDPWSVQNAQELMQRIAADLIKHGFNMVTGLGVGVGPFVVNGALSQLESEGTRRMDERLLMRPFPQGFASSKEQEARWETYRKNMLGLAGIAVFLFGNKADGLTSIVDAAGVEAEFAIAVSDGVMVVPVGCTGSVSAKLHKRVADDYGAYFPISGLKTSFNDLARTGSPEEVVARVIKVVSKIRESDR